MDRLDIDATCALARLALDEDEKALLEGQLRQVVEYVARLDEADLTAPGSRLDPPPTMAEDEPVAPDPDPLLGASAHRRPEGLRVPMVVDKGPGSEE